MAETKRRIGTKAGIGSTPGIKARLCACAAAALAAASLSCFSLGGEAYAAGYEAGIIATQAASSATVLDSGVLLVAANGSETSNASLAAALKAAKAGATVKLFSDFDEDAIYEAKVDLTIDLNGHSVSSQQKSTVRVSNNCSVAIVDSSAQGGGSISNTNASSTGDGAALRVLYGSAATVDSVSIGSVFNGVYNGGSVSIGNCEIEGAFGIFNFGTVVLENSKVAGGTYGLLNDTLAGSAPVAGNVTLKSGTVTGTSAGIFNKFGTLTVEGGEVSGTTHGLQNGAGVLAASSLKATANIQGGTVIDAYNDAATLNILGGTVKAVDRDADYVDKYPTYAVTANGGTVNMSGGVVENANGASSLGDRFPCAVYCSEGSENQLHASGKALVRCPNGYDAYLRSGNEIAIEDEAAFVCADGLDPFFVEGEPEVTCPEGLDLVIVDHDPAARTNTHMLGEAQEEKVVEVELVSHNGDLAADPASGVAGTGVALSILPEGGRTAAADDDTVLYKVTLNGTAIDAGEDGIYGFAMPVDEAVVEAFFYPKAFDLAYGYADEAARKAAQAASAVAWSDLSAAAEWYDRAAAFLADETYDFGDAETKAACESKLAAARAELAKIASLDMSGKPVASVDACMAALSHLPGLKSLDISDTGITSLEGAAAEQVIASLDSLSAKGLPLDSIAALAAAVAADGFDAAGKAWDLSGSYMRDSRGQIAPVAATFEAAGADAAFNPPVVLVSSVGLNRTSAAGEYGDSVDLAVAYAPSDADIAGVTWESSDESVAVVDSEGHVSFVGAGEAVITCTVAGADVPAVASNGGSATCPVVVNVAQSSIVEVPAANDLTYTGEAQALVSGGSAVGGTIVYLDEETGEFTETVPQGTVAGRYVVTYMVRGDRNHADSTKDQIVVNIARAADSDLDVTANKLAFTGEAQPLVTATQPVEGTLSFSVDGGNTWTTDIPTASEVGRYRVLYKVEGATNHGDDAVHELQVVIAKAVSAIEEAPAALAGLTYAGSDQELVSAGTAANGATLVYSLDGIVYGTMVPTGAMPRTYRVYYKVAESESYAETAAQWVDVTIAPAAVTVTADALSKAEGEDDPALTAQVSGLVGADTASVLRYSVSRVAGEAPGEYAVTVSGAQLQGGYTVAYEGSTFTVNAKAEEPADNPDGSGSGTGEQPSDPGTGSGGNAGNTGNTGSTGGTGSSAGGSGSASSNGNSSNNVVRNVVNTVNNYYTTNTTSGAAVPASTEAAAAPAPQAADDAAQAAPAGDSDDAENADDADDAATPESADAEEDAVSVGESNRNVATQNISDAGVPLSSGVQIEDDGNALSSGVFASWSLFDLIATFGLGILAVAMLVERALRSRERTAKGLRAALAVAGTLLAVAGIVGLVLTQDFNQAMATFDSYSVAYAVGLVAEVVSAAVVFALGKRADSEDSAEYAGAVA